VPGIALPADDLGSHVGHRASDRGVVSRRGIMNCDIEVSEMGMAGLVEEDIVGLEITENK
jgi:hypothetical protein